MNSFQRLLKIPSTCFDLSLKAVQVRNYAFKSNLKIKWVRPEHIPSIKPEKSGDLEPIAKLDTSRFLPEYANCKELETADPVVQKLFTLEFAPRKKVVGVYANDLVDKIKRHPYDVGSAEAKITKWTAIIRSFQEVMEKYPRNKILKVKLKELIEKRKKHLKYLRRWDYKRFEWLIDNLNIVYKPPPSQFHWITRKDSLRKLTKKYCDDKVNEKLEEFKKKLESEQVSFLEKKLELLKFLKKEQIECGVEVTVTDDEINSTEKMLHDKKNNQKQVETD